MSETPKPQCVLDTRTDALSQVVTVPSVPPAVGAAREWARRAAQRWRLGATGGSIEQVVSELVTNSIEHAECAYVTILLGYTDGVLRLEVRDQDAARIPVLKHPEPGDVGGRGLVIVQALSDRWGVQVTDSGKAVWCEFALPPPAPAP